MSKNSSIFFPCAPDQFRCSVAGDETQCIDRHFVCDGDIDCQGASDESIDITAICREYKYVSIPQ